MKAASPQSRTGAGVWNDDEHEYTRQLNIVERKRERERRGTYKIPIRLLLYVPSGVRSPAVRPVLLPVYNDHCGQKKRKGLLCVIGGVISSFFERFERFPSFFLSSTLA